MRVSERYMRGKFRAGNLILPEANVKGTFALISLNNANPEQTETPTL